MTKEETPQMPVVEMLEQLSAQPRVRYHMPGHKGGHALPPQLKSLGAWDITEIRGTDNLHAPAGAIARAQALLANACGAAHSFFVVGGSTAGVHAMILASVKEGDKLLLDRNCHKSVMGGLAYSGAISVYIDAGMDAQTGLPACLTPKQVQQAVQDHPDAKALLITYPNYYGCCADLLGIAEVVHGAGMRLLVDEAHGAHLPYAPQEGNFPPSAAAAADMWVQSAHKTLPALTQTAYLHLRNAQDASQLQRVLAQVQTTSPSYILMASMDAARAWMQQHAEQALLRSTQAMDALRALLSTPQSSIRALGLEWIGRAGIHAMDPTRLVLDVSGTGMTGYQVERILQDEYDIWPEMADYRHIVLIAAAADDEGMECRLKQALLALSTRHGDALQFAAPVNPAPQAVMSVRKAMLSPVRSIPLAEAVGCIAADCVGLYPPGTPLLCPGERIQTAHVAVLLQQAALGAQLFGITDGLVQIVEDANAV